MTATLSKQWVETNPSNICFFPTDIHFYLASWYYAYGLWMFVYGCLWMLDGLVSFHPCLSDQIHEFDHLGVQQIKNYQISYHFLDKLHPKKDRKIFVKRGL